MKMVNYKDLLKEELKDPEFKAAYDSLAVEFSIVKCILQKRIQKKMSQEALAKKIGSNQATLSRLESGNYNPTIGFLKRVAKALDAKLIVSIV